MFAARQSGVGGEQSTRQMRAYRNRAEAGLLLVFTGKNINVPNVCCCLLWYAERSRALACLLIDDKLPASHVNNATNYKPELRFLHENGKLRRRPSTERKYRHNTDNMHLCIYIYIYARWATCIGGWLGFVFG